MKKRSVVLYVLLAASALQDFAFARSAAASIPGGADGTRFLGNVGNGSSWLMMVIGFFLAIVVHHLALFLGGRRKSGDISFALLVSFISIRVAMTSGLLSGLGPAAPVLFARLRIISCLPLLPGFFGFVKSLFPGELKPRLLRLAAVVSSIFLALGLLLPPRFLADVYVAYLPFAVLGLAGILRSIADARRARRSASMHLLSGTLLFGLALSLDISEGAGWLDPGVSIPIVGWVSVTALCSAAMGRRIQDAYDEAARVSLRLEKHNEELEAVVQSRTRDLREANKELKRMAETDALTGIANRRRFESALDEERRRAARTNSTLSVGMFDVDYFKFYNDTYGHLEGDDCLKRVASVLSSRARRPGDLAARYGGEEFALLMPETEKDGALAMVQSVVKEIENLGIPHEGSPFKIVTISAGVASSFKGQGDILLTADRALYEAKALGRNSVVEGD